MKNLLIVILFLLCVAFFLAWLDSNDALERQRRKNKALASDARKGREQQQRDDAWRKMMRDEYYEQEPAARVVWIDDMRNAGVDDPYTYFEIGV